MPVRSPARPRALHPATAAARLAPVPALALVLAVGLAACSGEGPAPDDPSPTPTATPEPGPTLPAPPPLGPLEEYLGFGDTVRTAEEWVAQITVRENLVAVCMAEQGFEYVPQVPSVDRITYLDGPVQGTREFVERWGYGLWSSPPGGSGGGFTYTAAEDPNWARVEEMSEAGRAAYLTALWGPVTESSADGSETREGGCADGVLTAAGPEAAFLAGVRDEAYAFLEALNADPRFAEVDAAWASCMADRGFAFANPFAAQQQFMDELDEEVADGVLSPVVAAERAPEEVRVAVADLDCQEATDWVARHRAIEIELQQEYGEARRADLEALAAALAGTPGP